MSKETNIKDFEIAIASNFTIEPIRNALNYWGRQLQLSHRISFAPSQQVLQNLISPDGLFSINSHGVNLIFLRLEDCWPGGGLSRENFKFIQTFLIDLEEALVVVERNHVVPLILVECPSSREIKKNKDLWNLLHQHKNHLLKILQKFSNVYSISEKDLFDLYPMESYEDQFAYKEGKIPYTKECFVALGTIVSRKIDAIFRKPYKVIVLDCDNTLWKGVCAEDEVKNLIIDKNHQVLQSRMVEMQEQGFLLCLCSKNLESDVWSAFEYHKSAMPLKREHVIAWRINWLPKSENIESLSKELNLSLDSFIFLDDNEIEIVEVMASCPQVACFQVPSRSSDIPNFLNHIWVLDKLEVSKADRQRHLFYHQDKERKLAAERAYSFEDFIKQLDLHLVFYPLTEDQVGRVEEMTSRINQFNFSGKRFSAAFLRQTYLSGREHCFVVEAKDRYGEYGIIACAFYVLEESSLRLDNLLISCRALGKRIEFKIWDKLCAIAVENDLQKIDIKFVKSERNDAAVMFLESIGIKEMRIFGGSPLTYHVESAFLQKVN